MIHKCRPWPGLPTEIFKFDITTLAYLGRRKLYYVLSIELLFSEEKEILVWDYTILKYYENILKNNENILKYNDNILKYDENKLNYYENILKYHENIMKIKW